jgi:hypothetical protein
MRRPDGLSAAEYDKKITDRTIGSSRPVMKGFGLAHFSVSNFSVNLFRQAPPGSWLAGSNGRSLPPSAFNLMTLFSTPAARIW